MYIFRKKLFWKLNIELSRLIMTKMLYILNMLHIKSLKMMEKEKPIYIFKSTIII